MGLLGGNFTNILWAVFTCSEPKSAKSCLGWLSFLRFLGAHKMMVKLTTGYCCRFHSTTFHQFYHHVTGFQHWDERLRFKANTMEFNNVSSYDVIKDELVSVSPLNLTNVTSLEGEFEFNHRLLLNVIAYSVMFIVGTIGNTLVCTLTHVHCFFEIVLTCIKVCLRLSSHEGFWHPILI